MRKSRYSEEKILRVPQEVKSGKSVKDVCREHGIASGTYYSWKAKYGGMDVNEASGVCTEGGAPVAKGDLRPPPPPAQEAVSRER